MTEPIKPQISTRLVRLVQDGILYEYTAGARLRPNGAILRRRNVSTNGEEIIDQDILRCGGHSERIKKLAADGKDVYLLFDDSNLSEQIGKVVKVEGKYRIQFIWLNPNWGPRLTIKDLILEGGNVYATASYSFNNSLPELLSLAKFEASPRDRPCHLDQ